LLATTTVARSVFDALPLGRHLGGWVPFPFDRVGRAHASPELIGRRIHGMGHDLVERDVCIVDRRRLCFRRHEAKATRAAELAIRASGDRPVGGERATAARIVIREGENDLAYLAHRAPTRAGLRADAVA
jgi:hypothetical protein